LETFEKSKEKEVATELTQMLSFSPRRHCPGSLVVMFIYVCYANGFRLAVTLATFCFEGSACTFQFL